MTSEKNTAKRRGSSGTGIGTAKLQNVSLDEGQSSSNIQFYVSGATWQIPVYNVNGNTVTMSTKQSYTNVKILASPTKQEKYCFTAKITLILPNQHPVTPTPSPTLTLTPTRIPTPTPIARDHGLPHKSITHKMKGRNTT